MSRLHPTARALIDRAKLREPRLPEATRARVHASILRRIAALGAATTATTSAGMTANAGVLGAGVITHVVASSVAGALTGVALIAAMRGAWMAPVAHLRRPAPALVHSATPGEMRTNMPAAARQDPSRSIVAPPLPLSPLPGESGPATPPRDATDARSAPHPRPASLPARVRHETPARAFLPSTHTAGSADDEPNAAPALPSREEPPRASELAADLEIMQRVHTALGAGQPEQALALLRTREAAVRAGILDEEAAAARISALCQLGRSAEARTASNSFLFSWPRSPLSMKVREGCSSFSGSKADSHR